MLFAGREALMIFANLKLSWRIACVGLATTAVVMAGRVEPGKCHCRVDSWGEGEAKGGDHIVKFEVLAHDKGQGQVGRMGAAQLQGQRVLDGIVFQEARRIPVDERPRGHHLGVQPDMGVEQAQEIPVMPVGPVRQRTDLSICRAPAPRPQCAP